MNWITILRELGYPATSILLLLIGTYFFHRFFESYMTTIVNRDLEDVRRRNSEQLQNDIEELRRRNSAQLQIELEDLRRRNGEQLEAARKDYAIAIEEQKARLVADANELAYVREHYAGIKEYSSQQAEALRQAYLFLFEHPEESPPTKDRIESVIANILGPLRRHVGTLDEATGKKIYAVANYLRDFQNRENELIPKKSVFWEITETARKFIKADRVAYRLGLVNRTLKEVQIVRVKVMKNGVKILGNYTFPGIGVEVEISQDEWMSDEVQHFLREGVIEQVQSTGGQAKPGGPSVG